MKIIALFFIFASLGAPAAQASFLSDIFSPPAVPTVVTQPQAQQLQPLQQGSPAATPTSPPGPRFYHLDRSRIVINTKTPVSPPPPLRPHSYAPGELGAPEREAAHTTPGSKGNAGLRSLQNAVPPSNP